MTVEAVDPTAVFTKGAVGKWLQIIFLVHFVPGLEKAYDQDNFKAFICRFLETVRGKPIIIGIGDQVMPDSLQKR